MKKGKKGVQFTVLIGASAVAEDVRRSLAARGLPSICHTGDLPGLRRMLVTNREERVVLCVVLDQRTIRRHGRRLRHLLADLRALPGARASIGVLVDGRLDADSAEFGFDVYTAGPRADTPSVGAFKVFDPARARQGPEAGSGPGAGRLGRGRMTSLDGVRHTEMERRRTNPRTIRGGIDPGDHRHWLAAGWSGGWADSFSDLLDDIGNPDSPD